MPYLFHLGAAKAAKVDAAFVPVKAMLPRPGPLASVVVIFPRLELLAAHSYLSR